MARRPLWIVPLTYIGVIAVASLIMNVYFSDARPTTMPTTEPASRLK